MNKDITLLKFLGHHRAWGNKFFTCKKAKDTKAFSVIW